LILNRTYKYWEFYYDEDPDEIDRQNLASVWSESWHNVDKIYNMTDDEIKEMLEQDIFDVERYSKKVNRRSIGYALKQLKEIKEEFPLEKIYEK
jgi:hypothetical protein